MEEYIWEPQIKECKKHETSHTTWSQKGILEICYPWIILSFSKSLCPDMQLCHWFTPVLLRGLWLNHVDLSRWVWGLAYQIRASTSQHCIHNRWINKTLEQLYIYTTASRLCSLNDTGVVHGRETAPTEQLLKLFPNMEAMWALITTHASSRISQKYIFKSNQHYDTLSSRDFVLPN
jgi:hypothetical protein